MERTVRLAVMQPYFLPYHGYFGLIDSVDLFIIFDTPRFQKKSWMTRNRVLHPDKDKDFKYIHINTMATQSKCSCSDVFLSAMDRLQFIENNLQVYKKMRAVNYEQILNDDLILVPDNNILFSRFIKQQLRNICRKIGINTEIVLLSDTDYKHNQNLSPGLHALEISKFFGATNYINAPGGKQLFDMQKYSRNGIKLNYIKPRLKTYGQGRRLKFVQDLSILDTLMFNKYDSIMRDIICYELE